MSDATKLQDLQWRAIELVNKIVECDASWEDRHAAIELVRQHLEARAEQTKPYANPACSNDPLRPCGPNGEGGCVACDRRFPPISAIFETDFGREHIIVAHVGDNSDLL